MRLQISCPSSPATATQWLGYAKLIVARDDATTGALGLVKQSLLSSKLRCAKESEVALLDVTFFADVFQDRLALQRCPAVSIHHFKSFELQDFWQQAPQDCLIQQKVHASTWAQKVFLTLIVKNACMYTNKL